MPTPPFRFKQFTVAQDGCAMKVNTDGVLLGAWQCPNKAVHILDIGTGTGVIALMMAQGNGKAQIDAIDIDSDAWLQAKQNFEDSPWPNRIEAIHSSLQNFKPGKKYGFIISNPPYFVNDFKSERRQRNVARHGIELDYFDLITGINRLMTENGKSLLIIPMANFLLLKSMAVKRGLFITSFLKVVAVEGKTPYVVMVQLERISKPVQEGVITIKDRADNFTEQYKELTRAFYLNF